MTSQRRTTTAPAVHYYARSPQSCVRYFKPMSTARIRGREYYYEKRPKHFTHNVEEVDCAACLVLLGTSPSDEMARLLDHIGDELRFLRRKNAITPILPSINRIDHSIEALCCGGAHFVATVCQDLDDDMVATLYPGLCDAIRVRRHPKWTIVRVGDLKVWSVDRLVPMPV